MPSSPRPTDQAHTRDLLRALRDVNSASRLSVRGDFRVSLEGCLSLDSPVEQGVRYRLRLADGSSRLLSIQPMEQALDIRLRDEAGQDVERTHVAELVRSEEGDTVAPSLLARWSAQGGSRPAEHFLRRVVRGIYAA